MTLTHVVHASQCKGFHHLQMARSKQTELAPFGDRLSLKQAHIRAPSAPVNIAQGNEVEPLRSAESTSQVSIQPSVPKPRQIRFRKIVRPAAPAKRDWRRRQPVHNPVTDEVLTVGVWRHSESCPKHAVVAGFDKYGRFFQRVVRHDFYGRSLPFQTHATSVGHNDVVFRPHLDNLDADGVRVEVDRILRLPLWRRPPQLVPRI